MNQLQRSPRTWLITGVAGFIGSNLLEALLDLGQVVVGLDNFATGMESNLSDVQARVGSRWSNFHFIKGDIAAFETCRSACAGVDIVLHHAALGSVPRSIADPISTNNANVSGFLNMCCAARDAAVTRFVYASSSAVYGDDTILPRTESRVGKPLSPYAVTKLAGELYADVFVRMGRLPAIGLRYFNVFGRRQDPDGPYAAVIPRWIATMLRGEPCTIFGDGLASRDFCYVENVIQANLLAAVASHGVVGEVFNIAVGEGTSLKRLHEALESAVRKYVPELSVPDPIHSPPRPGDIQHSLADIGKAREMLGYRPTHTLSEGIAETIMWYREMLDHAKAIEGR